MSKEAVLAFRKQVSEDAELGQLIRDALSKGQKLDFVALGQSRGFEFTAAEGKEVLDGIGEGELTDFELEVIAGGAARQMETSINHYSAPSSPSSSATYSTSSPLASTTYQASTGT